MIFEIKIKERLLYHNNRSFLVPVVGLEPTRCCHRQILSLVRLPIPSHRRHRPIYYTKPIL